VADIGHVVNFDLPHVPQDYVHRIGRTARAQATGHASSFCAPDELPLLRDIEKLTGSRVPRAPLPVDDAVFIAALKEERGRQADPGPRGSTHGVSARPAGQQPGRHARSHPRAASSSSSASRSGQRSSGGSRASSSGASSSGGGSKVVFSGGPKRR
jgi:ATP-dependent RNA helicase RhlE